jgi:hypothetical protein
MPKTAEKYYCEKCDFKCSKLSNWTAHLSTRKHEMVILDNKNHADDTHTCLCSKVFKFPSGLSRHRKKCPQWNAQFGADNEAEAQPNVDVTLITEIIKQNNEFRTMLMEQNSKIMEQNTKIMEMRQQTNVITNNTTNNTQFNLNVFLNETCKDALNIMDFVNNLKLENKDLENVGRV